MHLVVGMKNLFEKNLKKINSSCMDTVLFFSLLLAFCYSVSRNYEMKVEKVKSTI